MAHLADLGPDTAHLGVEQGKDVDHPVGHRPGRGLARPVPQPRAQHRGDLERGQELARAQEALARQPRGLQREHVERGNVAHVDDREAEIGRHRHRARQQLLHQLDRGREVAAVDRAQHHAGIDRDEFHIAPLSRDPFARGALGDGLGLDVGVGVGVVDVGPAALVEGVGAAVDAIDHRSGRGGLDEASDPRRLGEAQRAQRALARGDDQVVLMAGGLRGDRRGDMGDMGAAGHGLGPAAIGHELGFEQPEGGGRRIAEPRAQSGLAFRHVADRAVHRPAARQQLPDQLPGDVAGRPRHQNRACHANPPLLADHPLLAYKFRIATYLKSTSSSAMVGWIATVASKSALVSLAFTAIAAACMISGASGPIMWMPTIRSFAASTIIL